MKIVFLDAETVDIGDVRLGPVEALGMLTCHGLTVADEVAERIGDAQVVLTNKVVIGALEMEAASSLDLICACATGTNHIDLEAARERGIAVCNVAGYSTPGVVQHAVALLLNLASNVHRYASEAPKWAESPMFCRLDYPVVELAGRTLGIAGVGAIGSAVGKVAEGLGMQVVTLGRDEHSGQSTSEGWPRLPSTEFYRVCDAISLHCPLTSDTRHMINKASLARMRKGSFLINTGRGDLIDEAAVAEALRSGHLGGAGLDVLSIEPPPADHLLLDPSIPNLILTPHSAWASASSRQRLIEGVAENIRSYLVGERRNRVES